MMRPEERWDLLRKAKTYREFLETYLMTSGLSLSDFARATEFGRGFPGDVLSGKRRLTAKSSFRFERALKVPSAGKRLFRLLVAIEEADLHPEIDRAKISVELEALRTKAWKRSRTNSHEITTPKFQAGKLSRKMMAVYAAAGDPQTGASLREVESRTGFSEKEVLKIANELAVLQLLEFSRGVSVEPSDETRVLPRDLHLFLQTTDQSALLEHLFRQSAQLAVQQLTQGGKSQDEFYFNSSFCVRAEKLPELKKELRETVLKFIDDSIEDNGTKVVHLLTALHL